MVKKLVLKITEGDDPTSNEMRCVDELLQVNLSLLEIATSYKNKITEHYQNKSWDRYKKLSNEYELIFFSANSAYNISCINPVSRSFFKLWEVLHDFDEIITRNHHPMKCVFLAEGPGGFFEAFHKKRECIADECHGMTLRSCNKSVPDWKTNRHLPLRISYGKDGTGNLYSLENIMHFVETVGAESVDFVTADGGFDFSSDFNNQEEQSMRLIVSEVLSALLMQKLGGNFLLKVYDCFNEETLKMIHILKMFYRDIYIIKPLTSRPANSERYILCNGFHKNDIVMYEYVIDVLKDLVNRYEEVDIQYHLRGIPYNITLLSNIIMYNIYYTMRQVYYIQRTINYITYFGKSKNTVVEDAILDKHRMKSIKWCNKYGIPCRTHYA